jgi:hypothetical protein
MKTSVNLACSLHAFRGPGPLVSLAAARATRLEPGKLRFRACAASAPLALLSLALVLASPGRALGAAWAERAGGSVSEGLSSTAVDAAGNVYIAGSFSGSATFGQQTVTSAGGSDVYVSKLDPTGAWLWTRQAGGASSDASNRVTVDGDGNVFVAGYFFQTATFGSTTLTASGSLADTFVAKLDAAGNWLWARKAGGSTWDQAAGIAVDSAGSAYVAGYIEEGSHAFGSFTITSAGNRDIYLAKIDAGGTWKWASRAGGGDYEEGFAVAVRSDGSAVYVTGYFRGTASFGAISITSAGGNDAFVAKANASGGWLWAKGGGSGNFGADYGYSVAQAGGSVFATGIFEGTASFGGTSLTSAGSFDVWLAALDDAGGNWSWVRSGGGASDDRSTALGVDGSGRLWLAGKVSGSATFGGTTVVPGGGTDVLLATLDPNGTWLGARVEGGSNFQTPAAMAVHSSGLAFIGGTFQAQALFGDTQLTSVGTSDVFLIASLADRMLQRHQLAVAVEGLPACCQAQFSSSPPLGASTLIEGPVDIRAAPETVDDGGTVYALSGWTLQTGASTTSGAGSSGTIEPQGDSTLTWLYEPPQVVAVGQPVARPLGADEVEPGYDPPSMGAAFFWSQFERKLYALRPVTGTLLWQQGNGGPIRRVVTTEWPADPVLHVAGSQPVQLQPAGSPYGFALLQYTTAASAAVDAQKRFTAVGEGYSVLHFTEGTGNILTEPSLFEVVRTVKWDATDPQTGDYLHLLDQQPCTIGQKLSYPAHDDPGRTGFAYFDKARFDGVGPDRAYDRDTRTGVLLPVNVDTVAPDDDMLVVWYSRSPATALAWPSIPVRYACTWPAQPDRIVIASELGSDFEDQPPILEADFPDARVYHQPDPQLPGLNPNDEHALLVPNFDTGGSTLFALRSDLTCNPACNAPGTPASPYVLLKYLDDKDTPEPADDEWAMKVYQVFDRGFGYDAFQGTATAGTRLVPPKPLAELAGCPETSGAGEPYYRDTRGDLWARAAGTATVRYFYGLRPDFHFPDATAGQCVAWLDRLPGGTPGTPVDTAYSVQWPQQPASLQPGETLLRPKRGLPDILGQAAVRVVYEKKDGGPDLNGLASLVRLVEPLDERRVPLVELPSEIATRNEAGVEIPLGTADGTKKVPASLRLRLFHDPINGELGFRGHMDESAGNDPLLLLDVMSAGERDLLLALSPDPAYRAAVNALYHQSRNPRALDLDGNGQPDQQLLLGLGAAGRLLSEAPGRGHRGHRPIHGRGAARDRGSGRAHPEAARRGRRRAESARPGQGRRALRHRPRADRRGQDALRADLRAGDPGRAERGRRVRPREQADRDAAAQPGQPRGLRRERRGSGAGLQEPAHRDLRVPVLGRHRPGPHLSGRIRRPGPVPSHGGRADRADRPGGASGRRVRRVLHAAARHRLLPGRPEHRAAGRRPAAPQVGPLPPCARRLRACQARLVDRQPPRSGRGAARLVGPVPEPRPI